MEIQIQDLVQSIRKDGIEEAQKQADAIIAAAKEQASSIIEAAKVEASKSVEAAKREIESTKALVLQAERDAVLSVKKELSRMMEGILAQDISKALTEENLAKLILAAVNEEDPAAYAVEVEETKAGVKAQLADAIAKGLEIRPVKGMAGMKLCCKDGSGFYDFSDEEIASLLKPFIGELKV